MYERESHVEETGNKGLEPLSLKVRVPFLWHGPTAHTR